MPIPATTEFPKPKSWDEFEDMVWELFGRKWKDPKAQRYGKSGQAQHGVDIYGQIANPINFIAIQCKRYDNQRFTTTTIEKELEKVSGFPHPITEYIFVTTTSRDVSIQDYVLDLNRQRVSNGEFTIQVVFWEDISNLLSNPDNKVLIVKYYSAWREIFSSSTLPVSTDIHFDFANQTPPRTQKFNGRDAEINSLKEAFQDYSVTVIGGIAGIGKTYLVARFIELHLDVERVVWFECEQLHTEAILAQFAFVFSNRFRDESFQETIQHKIVDIKVSIRNLVNALNKHRCTVVLDNYHGSLANGFYLALIDECSKSLRHGKIIITCRQWAYTDHLFNQPYLLAPLGRLSLQEGISLLKELGLDCHSEELLELAHQKVDGHPKFLTLLSGLGRVYPFKTLLEELPVLPDRIYEFLQSKSFNLVGEDGQLLLLKLSIFDIPFRSTLLPFIGATDTVFGSFEKLVSSFLISKLDNENDYFVLHDLEKEAIKKNANPDELIVVHREIYTYYDQLAEGNYTDAKRSVYHAIHAKLWEPAQRNTERLLLKSLDYGLYDLVLEDSSWILNYSETNEWMLVPNIRGYVFRIKENFSLAIDSYRKALELATWKGDIERINFEIASTLVKAFDEGQIDDFIEAKEIYKKLLDSEDINIRLLAMSAVASLEFRDNNPHCIDLLQSALTIAKENSLIENAHFLPYELARGYAEFQGNFTEALKYAQEAVDIQKHLGFSWQKNPEAYYHTQLLFGRLLIIEGRFEEAIAAHRECVQVDINLKLELRLVATMHEYGKTLCIGGLYDKSIVVFENCINLLEKEKSNKELQVEVFKWLALAKWYSGDYKNALYWQLTYLHCCRLYQFSPEIFQIYQEQEIQPSITTPEILRNEHPTFVCPKSLNPHMVGQWTSEVTRENPHLRGLVTLSSQSKTTLARSAKIRRNTSCPCGSGKKFKYCCGK